MKISTLMPLSLIMTATLIGCGGGGGGGGDSPGGSVGPIAGGGIGGTSSGAVTGPGNLGISALPTVTAATNTPSPSASSRTLQVNDTRNFTVDDNTRIVLDDVSGSFNEIKKGMQLDVEIKTDVNSTLTSGTLSSVYVESSVKGPVTSTSPLQILGQSVLVSSATLFSGVTQSQLTLGRIVEVHGGIDASGVRASLITSEDQTTAKWRITGVISNYSSIGEFKIGTQSIVVGSAQITNCGSSLANGQYVRVTAERNNNFTGAQKLTGVLSIRCLSAIRTPDGLSSFKTSYEGILDTDVVNMTFTINGVRVQYQSSTVFENGQAVDLVRGSRVEAEGTYSTATKTLTASKIKFRDAKFRIIGSFSNTDPTDDVIELQGLNLAVRRFSGSEIEDNVFSTGPTVIARVEGYIDSAGNRFVLKAKSNSLKREIRGPIEAINTNAGTISFMKGINIVNAAPAIVSSAKVGQTIKVDNGNYSGNDIFGGTLELDSD